MRALADDLAAERRLLQAVDDPASPDALPPEDREIGCDARGCGRDRLVLGEPILLPNRPGRIEGGSRREARRVGGGGTQVGGPTTKFVTIQTPEPVS